jgi:hypothetical protein
VAVQFSDAVRNAELDSIETTVGASAVLKLRTGAQPATVATADSGTVVATMALPADWMSAAAAGVKSKLGTWEDVSADNPGTIAHWRLYQSDGTTAHAQGTAGTAGTDLILDNNVVLAGQNILITAWAFTAGNP